MRIGKKRRMRIVAKRTLCTYWEREPRAEQPLKAWHAVAAKAEWASPTDVIWRRTLKWTWDDHKNRINEQKHGLGFETAKRVFDDPLAVSVYRQDHGSDEERWHTVGAVDNVIVVVVHTWPEPECETNVGAGRIVSARKATAHERAAYEEGDFQ